MKLYNVIAIFEQEFRSYFLKTLLV